MKNTRTYLFYLIAILLVNALGLFNYIFMVDSAIYAEIAKNFVESGNYIDTLKSGRDWLDKPHFPFWMSALSMEVFGINTFGYKLPSFLFFVLGLFYTYKLANRFYPKEVGMMSVLILSSAFHIIISNNDVRAEAILLGLIVGATYHFSWLVDRFSWKHLLLGSLLTACAMMTKGIFTAIPIGSAILGQLIFSGRLKELFKWRWALAFCFSFLFILPEIYALYAQFDANPEKRIFGQQGVSGIRFFFWDSQFGRFFNSGPITGDGNFPFLFHTLLWAFAPWGILAYFAMFHRGKSLIKRIPLQEYYSISAFIPMFLLFALSSFQLPHYINILFPFLAILVAQYINQVVDTTSENVYKWVQVVQITLLLIAVPLLHHLFKPGKVWILIPICVIGALLFMAAKGSRQRIFYYSVLISIIVGGWMNMAFYPKLLSYQAGVIAAVKLNKTHPDASTATLTPSHLFTFYRDHPNVAIDSFHLLKQEHYNIDFLYAHERAQDSLEKYNIPYTILDSFEYTKTTELTGEFIYFKTRDKSLEKVYLITLNTEGQ